MKQLLSLIKDNNFLLYILLALVVFFSYHQLLSMYFWRDDYSTLYAVQQKDLFLQPIFAYPYHLNVIMSKIFWDFFGLKTGYYFGTEIILFIIASWALFYLLQKLFTDRRVAFFCTLVFSAGYIGQDALKMPLEGILSLTALNLILFCLLTLLIYLRGGHKLWFFSSLLFFLLALETAAHRTSLLIIILLVFNLILSHKKGIIYFFWQSLPFLLVFVIQYFFHPSALILHYKIGASPKFWTFLTNFSPLYLLNPFGTFWNMLVPTDWQEPFNRSLDIYNNLTLVKFWLAGLPAVLISLVLLIYLKLLRPRIASVKVLMLWIFLIFVCSLVLALAIYQLPADKGDLVASENGIVLFIFLLLWITAGGCKSRILSLLSLFTLFGLNMLFFLTIPERVLVSYNRYLLTPSFTSALLPIIFVTKELYLKDRLKRRLAMGLFGGLCLLLITTRFWFALTTQKEFVSSYSQVSQRMYKSLHNFLPDVKKKQVIYIEGANKQLNLSVGDAARVGFLGSEAAYAVHYQTRKDNIILPQTLGEIPGLLRKNPDLSLNDIHTFIYDERGLRETSQEVRKILISPGKPTDVSADNWQKDSEAGKWQLKIPVKISTFLPLETTFQLKIPPQEVKKSLEFSWSYNTGGLLDQPRSAELNLDTDGQWHEYKFTIPGGGEYLQTLSFDAPDKTSIEIGSVQFTYQMD